MVYSPCHTGVILPDSPESGLRADMLRFAIVETRWTVACAGSSAKQSSMST
jgi:hypothetical protein